MTIAETTNAAGQIRWLGTGDAALWGLGFLVMAAAHAGAILFLSSHRTSEPAPPPSLEKAMNIELAPLEMSVARPVQSESVASIATPQTVRPVTDPTVARPVEPQAVVPVEHESLKPAEPDIATTSPVTSPVAETTEPLHVQEVAEAVPAAQQPSEEIAAPVPVESAEAVLPVPAEPVTKPAPRQPSPKVAKQKPKPPKPTKPGRGDRAEVSRKPAAAPAEASPGIQRTAKAPDISPLAWQNQVQARVARSVRALGGRQFRGRVAIRFTVAVSGAITGVSIARSSGNGAIDQAAAVAVQRASPVPAPPPGVGRTLTLPVVFN